MAFEPGADEILEGPIMRRTQEINWAYFCYVAFGSHDGSMDYLSGRAARLNDVTLVIGNVSVTGSTILMIFESTNINLGVRVSDDADTFATSDTYSIRVIDWADQLHIIRVIRSCDDQLTTDLSTYRYSYYGSSGWNRRREATETTDDYAFAMSWQDISVPGSGSSSICFMFRSGLHYDRSTDNRTSGVSTGCSSVWYVFCQSVALRSIDRSDFGCLFCQSLGCFSRQPCWK
jgi:hypothetical protein